MKRPFIRAFIVGLSFIIIFYAFQVIRGIYLTLNYVPDIVGSYESVDYLQHKVSFGVVFHPIWSILEILGLFMLGLTTYFVVRKMRKGNSLR